MGRKLAQVAGVGAPFAEIKSYIKIARPDHWFKNIFMLPGVALATVLTPISLGDLVIPLIVGVLSTCLVASANYVINEWLDADFDRHHPVKKNRPCACDKLSRTAVYLEYALLLAAGLALASSISPNFFLFSLVLLVMGFLYNVPPVRTKDWPYLDVLSESINNPIRFLLGWTLVAGATLPPSSVMLAYWMGGAFLMGVKRYAEYRFIANPAIAGTYRRSFKFYTEEKLLVSCFFYAMSSAFFLAIFLIKYRIEFLITFPFFSILFSWYLAIGMKSDSVAQSPEKLYKEKRFIAFVVLLVFIVVAAFFLDLPVLSSLVEPRIMNISI